MLSYSGKVKVYRDKDVGLNPYCNGICSATLPENVENAFRVTS